VYAKHFTLPGFMPGVVFGRPRPGTSVLFASVIDRSKVLLLRATIFLCASIFRLATEPLISAHTPVPASLLCAGETEEGGHHHQPCTQQFGHSTVQN